MGLSSSSFDSTDYQHYVSRMRSLIKDLNQVNQDVLRCEQNFAKDNIDNYREHITNLLSAKNPMDYFKINRNYLKGSFQQLAKLAEKQNQLFAELNHKLVQESDSLFCLFPSQIQDAILHYRDSGVVPSLNPVVWKEFVEKFKN